MAPDSRRRINCHAPVLYRSIFDLARDFLEEQNPAQQDKMLSRYLKPDLLAIDKC